MNKVFVLLAGLLLLSSCQYQKQSKTRKEHSYVQESLARLADIPDTPMYVHVKNVLKDDENPNQVQIICTFGTGIKRQDLKKFYIEEMERLGWGLLFESAMQDIILVFHKPDGRYCVVSVQGRSDLVVTIYKAGD